MRIAPLARCLVTIVLVATIPACSNFRVRAPGSTVQAYPVALIVPYQDAVVVQRSRSARPKEFPEGGRGPRGAR